MALQLARLLPGSPDHQLPGFAESEPARRLVQRYTPPEPARPWQGIEEDFDGWVGEGRRLHVDGQDER